MADWAAMVEARDAEILKLKDLLRAENARANAAIDREEATEQHAEELADERDRYRLAWLSARRRDCLNSNHATEALELKDAEITRLRADLARSRPTENRESLRGTPRLEYMGADEDGEVWRLAGEQ
ncbi:hypothetical protein [Streptomyces lydicus]|uniref:hypothetical protein n=1 Tax=Streptomyces lydicus TaxID=47763 RepID=UPI0037978256